MSAFAVFQQDYSPLCGSPFGSCAKRMFASAFGLRDPDRRFAPPGMMTLDFFSVTNPWRPRRSADEQAVFGGLDFLGRAVEHQRVALAQFGFRAGVTT